MQTGGAVKPQEGLERRVSERVRNTLWPRLGKLLNRQRDDIQEFYLEYVKVGPPFGAALNHHFSAKKGNLTEMLPMFGVGIIALHNYANGKTTIVPLETYVAIASMLNSLYGTGFELNITPAKCGGFYTGLLLGL